MYPVNNLIYEFMREFMLILHFLGLAMIFGGVLSFIFLRKTRNKMGGDDAITFMGNTSRLILMGHIGLALSILSGGYLMTPYWQSLGNLPLLITKLILVVAVIVAVSVMTVSARKAGENNSLQQIRRFDLWGGIYFISVTGVVIFAVLVFR